MKKLLLFFILISYHSFGQIFTEGETDGSIVITPKGLRGKNNTNSLNVGLGIETLENTNSAYNTAIGNFTLRFNTTGQFNTALGTYALEKNIDGNNNIAIGYNVLHNAKSATNNIAIGVYALGTNTTGVSNVSIGSYSTWINNTGNENTALGYSALLNNSAGNNNTAIGNWAGGVMQYGDNNTFIGNNANPTQNNLVNCTAIGNFAFVDASNKVRIGNAAVTVIEGQVPWSNPSDRRLKENILYTNRLGLDFITRLQTVSYNYIADGNKTRYDGFIAQDVEKVMRDLGIPFSGLKKSDNGTYSLAYSDFVMPLVNAVRELNDTNKNQQTQIDNLTKKNEMLSASIEEIKAELMKLRGAGDSKTESK